MTVLSRLGPQLGFSARPHLFQVSSVARSSYALQHGHVSRALSPRTEAPGGRRNFSLGTAINTTVLGVQDVIHHFHVITGTPWYITIPLVALGVNLLRLPLYVYSRSLAQKQQKLNPLIMAWGAQHFKHELRISRKPSIATPAAMKKIKKTTKRIYRNFGLQQWKHWVSAIGIFPVWLAVIEALRRMSGGPTGMLGMLGQLWSGQQGNAAAATTGAPPQSTGEETWGSDYTRVDSAAASIPPAPAAPDVPALDSGLGQALTGLDPSLSTGGCLWFPDLTAADPTHVLPYMLSAVLFVNLLPKTMGQFRQVFSLTPTTPEQQQNLWRDRIRRAMMILALAVGPLTMNLPAAVHLYWISSSAWNFLQYQLLSRVIMPIRPVTIQPCKPQPRHIIPPPPTKTGRDLAGREKKP